MIGTHGKRESKRVCEIAREMGYEVVERLEPGRVNTTTGGGSGGVMCEDGMVVLRSKVTNSQR